MSSLIIWGFVYNDSLHIKICGSIFLWVQVLFFLTSLHDASANEICNMAHPILGFQNYLDVKPVRYIIPDGIDMMNFTFQTTKKPESSCPQKEILFVIQRGGLPLIKQNNLTFPSNFLVDMNSNLRFSLVPEVLFSFSISHPLPGIWYVGAYHEDVDQGIRQQGLHGEPCIYSYMSRLNIGEVTHTYVVNIEEVQTINFETGQQLDLSFKLPDSSIGFQVTVEKCEPEPCNLTLTSVTESWSGSSKSVDCSNSTLECVLDVLSPSLQGKQRVTILSHIECNITFVVTVNDCPRLEMDVNGTVSNSNESLCLSMDKLDRIQPMELFTAMYGYINKSVLSFDVKAHLADFTVVPFEVLDPNDVGSTLKWQMSLVNFSDPIVQVCGALLYDHLPNMSSPTACQDLKGSISRNYSKIEEDNMTLYVPYPRAGIWHILVQAICFDNDTQQEGTQCSSNVSLELALEIQSCQDKECDGRGECVYSFTGSDFIMASVCSCDAGYQGYACTDDSKALSVSAQLTAAYLLTLSNLFFVPAICLASRRRFFPEAFVYFYTMFFSTFYHACDGQRLLKYRECILDYNVLQMCDFYGSACSLWMTVLAMASITYKHITPLLQIAGVFGIFLGVVIDRHSLTLIVAPVVCGLVLIICSWGHKMYKRKKLYPSRNRYLFFLLPGLVMAAVGVSVFALVETRSNYKYVHSFWHVSMALCICLLLPRKRPGNEDGSTSESNMTTHLLSPLSSSRSSAQLESMNNGGYVLNASDSAP